MLLLAWVCLMSTGCSPAKSFSSGFETVADFSSYFSTPQPYLNTSTWTLQTSVVHSGTSAFMGTITGANPAGTDSVNTNNHRAYPTLQFHKGITGMFHTPVMVTFWVYLTATLSAGQWFSFATFVSDTSDTWNRTVLLNLSDSGYVNFMHVPYQEQAVLVKNNTTVPFPYNQWVQFQVYLDFTPDASDASGAPRGYAMAWQNGTLISSARVGGMNGVLAQAHFGLYAPPALASATVYNDDLSVVEVTPQALQQ